MTFPRRVTPQTLDILEVLLRAYRDDRDVYGWEVRQATRQNGPVVIGVFGRLAASGLVVSHWANGYRGPRRHYYRLTPDGAAEVAGLLARRRPEPAR